MTPVEKGRFCASCQKNVIDLSILTDREIVDICKTKAGENICVRLHKTQIDHPFIEKPRPSLYAALLKRIAASVLFLQAVTNTLWAQTVKPKAGHQYKVPDHTHKTPVSIKGRLMDNVTKKPFKGALVEIDGTGIRSKTDNKGNFSLQLPDSFYRRSVIINASYPQHKSSEMVIWIHDNELLLADMTSNKPITLYAQEITDPVIRFDRPDRNHFYTGEPEVTMSTIIDESRKNDSVKLKEVQLPKTKKGNK